MHANRLFNLVIAVLLVLVIAFTVREASATSVVVSQADHSMLGGHDTASSAAYCLPYRARLSLTSVYVKEINGWFPRTANGYTGVDGGLLELLSNARACSGIGMGQ